MMNELGPRNNFEIEMSYLSELRYNIALEALKEELEALKGCEINFPNSYLFDLDNQKFEVLPVYFGKQKGFVCVLFCFVLSMMVVD